jgi:hypothetical protein
VNILVHLCHRRFGHNLRIFASPNDTAKEDNYKDIYRSVEAERPAGTA